MSTVEAIQEYIKADSLEYLSHDGMMEAVRAGIPAENEVGHCSACMTGAYPVAFDP
jgi:glutamine phosphoribosylpyrophosphate amidotransferase